MVSKETSIFSRAVLSHDMTKLSHLKDIDVLIKNTKEVMLLAGTYSPAAHKPLEVRYGNNAQPYAAHTRFGLAVRRSVGTTN